MNNYSNNNFKTSTMNRKNAKLSLDQSTLLGGLSFLILGYIVFQFVYPLINKGLLW